MRSDLFDGANAFVDCAAKAKKHVGAIDNDNILFVAADAAMRSVTPMSTHPSNPAPKL